MVEDRPAIAVPRSRPATTITADCEAAVPDLAGGREAVVRLCVGCVSPEWITLAGSLVLLDLFRAGKAYTIRVEEVCTDTHS